MVAMKSSDLLREELLKVLKGEDISKANVLIMMNSSARYEDWAYIGEMLIGIIFQAKELILNEIANKDKLIDIIKPIEYIPPNITKEQLIIQFALQLTKYCNYKDTSKCILSIKELYEIATNLAEVGYKILKGEK